MRGEGILDPEARLQHMRELRRTLRMDPRSLAVEEAIRELDKQIERAEREQHVNG